MVLGSKRVDTANKVITAKGNQAGDDEQQADSHVNGKLRLFVIFLGFLVKLGMGFELEDKEKDINNEHDDLGCEMFSTT